MNRHFRGICRRIRLRAGPSTLSPTHSKQSPHNYHCRQYAQYGAKICLAHARIEQCPHDCNARKHSDMNTVMQEFRRLAMCSCQSFPIAAAEVSLPMHPI